MSAAPPIAYEARTVRGMQVLAYDEAGGGRVVEVLGDLGRAERIAVLVPGNAHSVDTYLTEAGGASPRANGRALRGQMQRISPHTRTCVVVWVGYRCPKGFVAGARTAAAAEGAADLARLTHMLPRAASVTLIGHSYGTALVGLAVPHARVDDVVALASPGMGVRNAAQLRTDARVWATRSRDDWVRFVPKVRVVGLGHGPSPTHPRFGATTFSTGSARGHSGYYAEDTESLLNIARIALGRHADVTLDERRRALAQPVASGGEPLVELDVLADHALGGEGGLDGPATAGPIEPVDP